jgi:hypothetical protein
MASRRGVLWSLTAAGIGLTGWYGYENRNDVRRWSEGQGDPMSRDLAWHGPDSHQMGDASWHEFGRNGDAVPRFPRSWDKVGRLIVAREIFDKEAADFAAQGRQSQQAVSTRKIGGGDVGISRDSANPDFFGIEVSTYDPTKPDVVEYQVAVKVGFSGVAATLGHYLPGEDAFVASAAVRRQEAIPVEQLPNLHPQGVWVANPGL